MVCIMNELLELEVGMKVLEVGAGSGYHAATIAEIVAPEDVDRKYWGHVFTIEINERLYRFALENIRKEGYEDRVTVIHGDGSKGLPEEAPFDRILVTAAAPSIPETLIRQLKDNGILVIPVGRPDWFLQSLIRVRKKGEKIIEEFHGHVAFVPLRGEYGWK